MRCPAANEHVYIFLRGRVPPSTPSRQSYSVKIFGDLAATPRLSTPFSSPCSHPHTPRVQPTSCPMIPARSTARFSGPRAKPPEPRLPWRAGCV
eukprot:scaffold9772_cov128-Isochrysis_galbana.AAC.8